MTDFRQKCLARTNMIGTFCAIPHPVAVEVTAQAGPDFVCIDWEHAQIGRDQVENLVRAADVQNVPAMVRVPGHRQEDIAAALDSGARLDRGAGRGSRSEQTEVAGHLEQRRAG